MTKINTNYKFDDKVFLFLIMILAATFIVFAPALNNNFVKYWDDLLHLLNNRQVRSLTVPNIIDIFQSTINKTYIPLTTLSFAFEYYFFKYNPFVYHLDNLFLHLGIVTLVFLFCLRFGLSLRAASFASFIFAIHPMRVESVVWVTERKDVLYGFFYLLALNSYWKYVKEDSNKEYILTIVFGMLSILAKPMALSLPLIFFVCDWYWRRKLNFKLILEKVPHLIYVVPISWITLSLNLKEYAVHENLFGAFLIYVWTFVFYVQKFFFPIKIGPIYDLPLPISITNFYFIWSLLLFALVIMLITKSSKNRLLGFAALYYVFSIFFLFRYDLVNDTYMVADRWMYLPSLGICMFLGFSIDKIYEWSKKSEQDVRRFTLTLLVFIFLFLGIKTMMQCAIWKNDEVLFTYIIKNSAPKGLVYNNRGIAYDDQGKYDLAIKDYTKAIKIDPKHYKAYNNRGVVFMNLEMEGLALADFNRAIEINPKYLDAYNNRGNYYQKIKEYDLALKDYEKVIELDSQYYMVYNNRASIYYDLELYDLAIKDLTKMIRINPNYVAYYNRGSLYNKIKKYDKAIYDLNYAVYLNKSYEPAYYQRSLAYKEKGDYVLALRDALKAKSLGYIIGENYFKDLMKKQDK